MTYNNDDVSKLARHRFLLLPSPGTEGAAEADRAAAWCTQLGVELLVAKPADTERVMQLIGSDQLHGAAIARELSRQEPVAALRSQLGPGFPWIEFTPHALPCLADDCISGRGENSLKWALRYLVNLHAHPFTTLRYGSGSQQVGDLRIPQRPDTEPWPLVVLLHGGFWREAFRRDMMTSLAVDLATRGFATWNVEYRRTGGSDGGFPNTFLDVAAAMDFVETLCDRFPLDRNSVAVLGHSAGAHLALWSCARRKLPAGIPGAAPKIIPRLCVALGGITDLARAERLNLGGGAVRAFVGADVPRAWVSPREMLPLGVTQLIAHSSADQTVPCSLSREYVEAARSAGDAAEYLEFSGIRHMRITEPDSDAWKDILGRLQRSTQSRSPKLP